MENVSIEIGEGVGYDFPPAPVWADRVVNLQVPPSGGPAIFGRPCKIAGWSIREAAGTPAAAGFDLYDGPISNGELIATASLPASGTVTQWFGYPGPASVVGLNFNARVGTVAGVIYVVDEGP